jgi:hypothetical protein
MTHRRAAPFDPRKLLWNALLAEKAVARRASASHRARSSAVRRARGVRVAPGAVRARRPTPASGATPSQVHLHGRGEVHTRNTGRPSGRLGGRVC